MTLQKEMNFRRLVIGKSISDFGSYFDMVALNVFVYAISQSAIYTGFFMAVRMLGGVATSFYAGVLADKYDRKKLMVYSDVVRSVAIFLLVIAPIRFQIPALFLAAIVLGVFNSVFNVSLQASIPALLGAEQRIKANATLASVASIAMVLGTACGGIAISLIGYKAVFIIDAITYALSALNLQSLHLVTKEENLQETTPQNHFKQDLSITWIFLKSSPLLLAILGLRLLDTFGSASHNIGLPIISKSLIPEKPALMIGFIYATWAIGKIISSAVIARKNGVIWSLKNHSLFGVSTVFMSAFFIALFYAVNPIIILCFSVLAGIADGWSEITFQSELQTVSESIRGKIFGVAHTFQTVGFGTGMILCSPLFEILAPKQVVGILHGLPMVLAIVFTVWVILREKQSSSALQENAG